MLREVLGGIRKRMKGAFERFGYKIEGLHPSNVGELRLCRTFESFDVGIVYDVGANRGQYGKSLRKYGYEEKIVSFEPLSSAHEKLAEEATEDPRWTVAERVAVSDSRGEQVLHISENSVSSSLHPIKERHVASAPESEYVREETVPKRRLDEIMEKYEYEGKTGSSRKALKIDTQGHEEAVLAGAGERLREFAVIQLEMSLVELYEGQKLFDDLKRELEDKSFEVWSLLPGFTDPESGRMLQCDGIFVREDLFGGCS
jgi:FkbM family methyltransferase